MIVKHSLTLVALLTTCALVRAEEPPPSAANIIEQVDKLRNPAQPFRVSLTLVEYKSGQAGEATNLAVHSKLDAGTQQYRNIVRYVAPPRDSGKLALLNASNMWFYDPASKASIRISAAQRLIGQASYGDVLTVNLSRDYKARIVGEERVQDADKQAKDAWHLDLSASTPDAAYARLETWIEKGTFRPIKSKFYSESERVLKLAYYRRYEPRLGGERAMETIIIDAVNSKLVTKISYSDFRAAEVKDAWFTREYLPRFSEE